MVATALDFNDERYQATPAKGYGGVVLVVAGNSMGTGSLLFGGRAILSVDFATRDGSALAGQDYLAVQGRLNLYPDETQAVIAVEIIGDTDEEGNENFFLEVFNPVGGSFVGNAVALVAMRTIIDDDGLYL